MKNKSKHEAMPFSIKSKPISISEYPKYNRLVVSQWTYRPRTERMINDVLIEVQLFRKSQNLRPSPLWLYFLIANHIKLYIRKPSLK